MPVMEDDYQQTLDYIYSFIDFSIKKNFKSPGKEITLDRILPFIADLGSPQLAYPVIHVAGTKGKGSVCALCASALKAAGYKVGLYTSPHLMDFTERMQVNGEPIAKTELVALVNMVRPVIARHPHITMFDLTTALAFLFFKQQQVDVAVIEVGLGGRIDSTNVVDPLVAVITSISFDHTQILGNTLAQIATEKAGIIKTGKPVVMAKQMAEAAESIKAIASTKNAPIIDVDQQTDCRLIASDLQGQTLGLSTRDDPAEIIITLPLLGAHQRENAAAAYAALMVCHQHGLPIQPEAVARGFAATTWAGRFEILNHQPMVVIDCAHNLDSAQKLAQTFTTCFPDKRALLVFGVSEDKDISGIITALMPICARVIATQSTHPRALAAESLVELFCGYNRPIQSILPFENALQTALDEVAENQVILVTGSIFMAAAARQVWFEQLNR